MDTYEGRARLEWWANRSTSLGGFDVRVTACATDSGWTCEAILDGPLSAEHQEVFHVLMQADPVFTLCFDEGSEILVDVADVAAAGDGGRLAFTVCELAESGSP
ncbi:hypothetical protein OG321_36565 [Streptomyces sp. NBC_00424]|uniref:hypothetical protein n=1 Tax=Streptomyces sp. NBC_00424 TaxID=2903648 RepID=UPI0022533544|nr:hypothetical protein [Streptomyces sp. NBC_00424]MCX5077965.1 hypothetical protein [Streptomyces sp. NBC_00424]